MTPGDGNDHAPRWVRGGHRGPRVRPRRGGGGCGGCGALGL